MSLAVLADHLASKGRNGDTMLVHMAPEEVRGLHALALAHGGSLTINPDTGLPEASFLKRLLPMIAGMALNAFLPGVGSAIGSLLPSALGLSAATAGAIGTGIAVGGITGLARGSLKEGILAGLGAYGGASLVSGLAGAGAGAAQDAATSALTKEQIAGRIAESAGTLTEQGVLNEAAAEAAKAQLAKPVTEQLAFGARAAAAEPLAFAKTNVKPLMYATAPLAEQMLAPPNVQLPSLNQPQYGPAQNYTYAPGLGYLYQGTQTAKSGGLVALAGGGMADGGATREQVLAAYRANPLAELNPNEEAINYWMGQGLGSFNDVVKSARAESPGLATFIDATRNPAATTAATTPFATAETTLPNYLGLNAVAAGAPTTFVSSSAPTGYDYAAAQAKTQNEQAVNEIYNRVLGRQAEQGGLDYWAGQLNQGANLSDVERQIKNVASNIGVKVDPTQLATPTAAQLAAQQSILADPQAAALAAAKSGLAAGMTDQQIADMVNMQYGKSFSAQNVADFMKAQGLTRVPVIESTPTPILFPGTTPGVISTGEPFTPTAPTAAEVKKTYETGGGSTTMPTITDIKPTDRTYTQNDAFNLLRGYLQTNPNAQYQDVVGFARSRGIPDMQARAAYNEFRFSMMSGGTQQAYDYLMGRGAYPIKPFTPTGEIMRPYEESVLGFPENRKAKAFIFDPVTRRYVANPDFVPRKSSTMLAAANPRDQAGNLLTGNPKSYFAANPDVYAEWMKGKTGMTADEYAKFHWETMGKKEGRTGWTESASGGSSGGKGSTDTDTSVPAAKGGLMDIASAAAARGGNVQQYNLGGYSDGGRLLRGPGDGVSDSIPATIGNKQPARLADGEFVVPARIVSEIGNGSTEAGARKLYAMMDRVQRARSKTVGKGKVAKDTQADKYLPA